MCDCVGGPQTITDWACGDVVCRGCGVVMEAHIIDERAAWQEADHQRQDHHHSDQRQRRDQRRDQRETQTQRRKRARVECAPEDPKEASLREGARVVDGFVAAFGQATTSNMAVTARELFRDLHEARGVRADVRRATAAAAVYYGFKLEGAGRELSMVSAVCEVDARALNSAANAFKEALHDRPYYPRLFDRLQAGKLVDVCLDRLRLDPAVRKRMWRAAHRLDERLAEMLDCGRKPKSLCSGVLFLAAELEGIDGVGKKDIAAACCVNQQTVVNVVAHMRANLNPASKLSDPVFISV